MYSGRRIQLSEPYKVIPVPLRYLKKLCSAMGSEVEKKGENAEFGQAHPISHNFAICTV